MIILTSLFASCKSNTENKSNDISDSAVTANSSTGTSEIHKNIHIKAKPDSIAIDAASTAVICHFMDTANLKL